MSYFEETVLHESPLCTTCHLLQLAGCPVWVGPGGPNVTVVDADGDVAEVLDCEGAI